ncbi:unnamed protein product [Linum trigynum]|uniref:Uncharacterized protein n=1 Tax=Linum trigynum TaxID=586398 RepID=A0AAV2G4F5_9ROSI
MPLGRDVMVTAVTSWNVSESPKMTSFGSVFKLGDRDNDLCVPSAIFLAAKLHHVRDSTGITLYLLLGCMLKFAILFTVVILKPRTWSWHGGHGRDMWS